MTLFSCSELSKSFEEKLLFENISFGMEEGERVGIIGRNGVGKTTLLRCLAGVERVDSGTIAFNKNFRFEYLEQLPQFSTHATCLSAAMDGKPHVAALLRKHEDLCAINNQTAEVVEELQSVSARLEELHGWTLDQEATRFLALLGIQDVNKDVMTLSGGQRKRVAIARALLSSPDLLILDEPTNHLDAQTVQWLQDELQTNGKGLLLITHDRYFLDALSTKIIELDKNKLFVFPGNFEKYLERKEQMLETESSTAEHLRNKLRTELAWLQKGAKARRTKQQSRINWIQKMQNEPKPEEEKNIKIEVGNIFLGGRIIDAYNISRSINGTTLFTNFTYNAAPGDRIGIIGPNGTGKSTLLNTLCGALEPETGSVKIGESVRIGYFKQEVPHIAPTQTLIGAIREVAEYIDTGVGRDRYLSAKDLLDRFLFPTNRHGSRIETLSGGERRRLELCRILMANPNVLLLDEPTNDFDIATLSALEEYLQHFKGVLIVVSHDRSFLDKTVEFIYAFESGGTIKQYPGNYTTYLEKIEQRTQERREQLAQEPKQKSEVKESNNPKPAKKGLSYKEQREYNELEERIVLLDTRKTEIEQQLSNPQNLSYQQLAELGIELEKVQQESDTATERWFELSEKLQ